MVHSIDGDHRRRLLSDAVWQIMERDGLDAASVRGVAAEAGLSAGSVRHFFTSQSDLHLFALTSLSQRVRERIGHAATEPDLQKRVMAMVAELLPLRADTTRELTVWIEFVHRARHDEAMQTVITDQAGELRAFASQIVKGLVQHEHLPSETDVMVKASGLHALVDGIAFQMLTVPGLIGPAQAREMVHTFLFATHNTRAEQ